MKKRILSLITVLTMLASLIVLPTTAQAETTIKLGDYVQMGTYYGEPVLWRCVSFEKISGYDSDGNPIIDSTDTVTEYQDGYLPLMLSDEIICLKPFDAGGDDLNGSHARNSSRTSYGSNYWADSNMRSWLNSSENAGNVTWLCGDPPFEDYVWNGYNEYDQEAGFLTNFTESELNAVKTVTQKSIVAEPEYNNGIYDFGSEPLSHSYIYRGVANYADAYSEQVTDTMFLLDIKQVNTVYNNSDVLGDDYYIGEPTEACVENSEYTDSSLSAGNKWDYWLRSPGIKTIWQRLESLSADAISFNKAYNGNDGVRPAFFLTDTATFTSGSGTENNPYTVAGSSTSKPVATLSPVVSESDDFPESLTIDYNERAASNTFAGTQHIGVNDPNATFEIEDENVAELEDDLQILPVGETEFTDISVSVIPKSPGRTVITAHLSDGTEKKCNLTVTGIKINLNGEALEFDQAPINQDGNLLVPIRAIAEAMGKKVLWSSEEQAAFIDNTESALIIPIGQTTLYLGTEQAYSTWEQVETNVPAQIINDRTLVPIRQFSEALGANVEWVDKYSTANITYDNIDSEKMSEDLYDAINLNYYIGHYSSNPFETYNELAIEPFYESRNSTVDAIAMGISKPWSAINDLISSIYGNTNASNIIQQTLYDVISEIDDTSDSSLSDTSILTDLVSYEKAGIKIYNDASGFDKDFLEAHPDLKSLNDSIKNTSTALDWFIFTTDELAYIFTNYSMNISYLDVFEEALSSNGELDDNVQEAIDDLRDQYANKFLELLIDVQEELTNNTFSSAMSLVTGGTYSLGKLAWKTVFKATGVTKKGEALKTFYGIYCYNAGLDRAFGSAMKSSKDSVDLSNIKALIQLQKATKKTAIESIKDIAYSWATEEKAIAQTYIDQLDSWTYYIWDAPTSDGSGGSSW
ncbi:MAG: copper amine oxidase N-terminal domain-containing protein [Firmicutes bacterium]|nr:copper amine oxidase N-terminal domain-containing protein [Bacillota bacterium]